MKKKLTIIVLLALIAAIMIPATFAWIADNSATDFGITSYVHKSYFESGDGTSAVQYSGNEAELGYNDEGCAFEIKYPVQFYYFTWLQYMGYFNQAKTEEGHTTEINQVYFYLSADLYMDGWILPPVGTDEFPFLGSFNGNGHTIHNLTVQNVLTTNVVSATTLNDIPESIGPVEIVGLFGVVGSPSTIGTANASYESAGDFLSTTGYTYDYDTAINEIKNFKLNNLTLKADALSHKALIGAVAGYLNATVAHADVISAALCIASGSGAIDGKTNISDYSVIGYDAKELSTSATAYIELAAPTIDNTNTIETAIAGGGGSSSGDEWGGSIDMYGLYSRLLYIYDNYAIDSGTHTEREITYLDAVGNIINVETVGVSGDGHFKGYYSATDDYSYTFNKYSATPIKDFMYLYGDVASGITIGTATTEHISKQQTSVSGQQVQITYSEEASGFYISSTTSGTKYYLATTGSGTATRAVTNEADAAVWQIETYNGNQFLITYANGSKQYLGMPTSDGSNVALSNSRYNSRYYWFFWGNNNRIYVKDNSTNRYIYYDAGNSRWRRTTTSSAQSGIIESFTKETFYALSIDISRKLSASTNISEAASWLYQNNKIFTVLDGSLYYLVGSSSGVILSETVTAANATNWSVSASGLSFIENATTYYLHLSPSLGVSTSAQTLEMTNAQVLPSTTVWQTVYVGANTSETTGSDGFETTYIPLSVSESNIFQTQLINTGYIVSGKASATGTEADRYQQGDIRVSKYLQTNLSSTSTVYTIGTNGVSTDMSDFEKYEEAREGLDRIFAADTSWIYGLHFMNATIDSNNTVTIPNALINGRNYPNYDVPKACIDFNLKDKGYITFFAGTYFAISYASENDVFFSLHQITRDAGNNITAITPINTIYQKTDGTYEYNSQSAGSTLVFNTAWLTSPKNYGNWYNNALYYFEIPVNAGEYALGSTSGNGAYLMYLDISASGGGEIQTVVPGTSIVETQTETVYNYQYVKGVGVSDLSAPNGVRVEAIAPTLSELTKAVSVADMTADNIFILPTTDTITDAAAVVKYLGKTEVITQKTIMTGTVNDVDTTLVVIKTTTITYDSSGNVLSTVNDISATSNGSSTGIPSGFAASTLSRPAAAVRYHFYNPGGITVSFTTDAIVSGENISLTEYYATISGGSVNVIVDDVPEGKTLEINGSPVSAGNTLTVE